MTEVKALLREILKIKLYPSNNLFFESPVSLWSGKIHVGFIQTEKANICPYSLKPYVTLKEVNIQQC